jgi:hypothetical protein
LLNDSYALLLRFLCMPDQWGRKFLLLILGDNENAYFRFTSAIMPPAVGTIRIGKATFSIALSSLHTEPFLATERFVLKR